MILYVLVWHLSMVIGSVVSRCQILARFDCLSRSFGVFDQAIAFPVLSSMGTVAVSRTGCPQLVCTTVAWTELPETVTYLIINNLTNIAAFRQVQSIQTLGKPQHKGRGGVSPSQNTWSSRICGYKNIASWLIKYLNTRCLRVPVKNTPSIQTETSWEQSLCILFC